MNAVWSIENIGSDKVHLTEAEIATLIVSVSLWKKCNPNDTTILYCDKDWYLYFNLIDIIKLWDKVDYTLLEQKRKESTINKNIFWAATKIVSLKATTAPVIHLDNDYFAIKKLSDYGLFESDVAVAFKEETKDFYISPEIATKGAEIKEIKNYEGIAYNTSIMYFKDETVKNNYCDMVLKYMRDASLTYDINIHNKDGCLYMIFAEQQLLGEFCATNNLGVKMMIKEKFYPNNGYYLDSQNMNGLFHIEDMDQYAGHLGEVKKEFRNNSDLSSKFAINLMNKINSL